mmetsp:Transcript_36294/g.90625  ORF Transcript_36294/g.90625 Transcript_36294/m.90625 type:complete len:210 (-) Transcript_36294:351-980(-)
MTLRSSIFRGMQVMELESGSAVEATTIWADKKVLLLLVRRFGCVFCQHQTSLVLREEEVLKRHNYHIVAVGNGTPDQARKFKDALTFTHPIYIDSDSQMFKALSMPRWSFWYILRTFFMSSTNFSIGRGLMKDYPNANLEGDGYQSGGIIELEPGESAINVVHREAEKIQEGQFCEPTTLLEKLGIDVGESVSAKQEGELPTAPDKCTT